MIVPLAVRGSMSSCVASSESCVVGEAPSSLASPKSNNFVPDFVIMMLPGFKSRWTMPFRCALSKCVGDLDGVFESGVERQATFLQPGGQRVAFHQFHDDVVDTVLFANIVERTDVRVVQAADGTGFSLEASTQMGVAGEMFWEDFDNDSAVQTRVDGGVHFSHTAGTELVADCVWTKASSFCERHTALRHFLSYACRAG